MSSLVEETVPLSEEELRLLEQMERALQEEDPKFASALRGNSLRRAAQRRAILAGVVFAGGIAVLMTGVIARIPAVGIVGFLIMLLSATVCLSALRGKPARVMPQVHHHHHASGFSVIGGGKRRNRRFMDIVEERWTRRREDNGGW